jgi:D-alanyl-D-alanine-carboxypeptidase/D-alanyl-D-alanine-endopeptidase
MMFEDLKIIWREGDSQSPHTHDDETLHRIVMERARTYRRKILLKDFSEIGLNVVVVALLLWVGVRSFGGNGWSFSINSAPLILIAVGYALISAFIFVGRQLQRAREKNHGDSVRGNLEKLVANTDYQIRLQRNFIWWYLLPVIPGFTLLAVSNAKSGPFVPWMLGGLMCFIFGIIYWGSVVRLRKELIPQKQELEFILEGLERSGGQTVEIQQKPLKSYALFGNKRRIVIAISFALALAAVCLGLVGWLALAILQPYEEPSAPQFDDISAFGESDIAQVDAWLQEQVEVSEFPSLSVAIVRDGQTVYQRAFGFENTWTRTKATTNTAYHVASVTKAFTASLAVLLHDRGVIDLDLPVARYLPKGVIISTRPEVGAKITLRQLASHTSGLPRTVIKPVQSVEGRYQLEPQRLYDQLAEVALEFNPGTDELYSNLGFGLLGHALELAAGKPYEQLLQEMLCAPLHLERTSTDVNDKFPVATGYSTPPQLPEGHSYRERFAGSGGLVTSVGDLVKFLSAQMKPGLFSSEMLAQLHTPATLSNDSMAGTALGWSVEPNETVGRILEKNGGRNNCSAWIGFSAEHKVGVAVISNCGDPEVDSIGLWLLERAIPGGHKPVTKHGFAKVSPFTGVRWENNQPIVHVQGEWARLVSIDGLPVERIMEFAQKEFGEKARMRFGEDLVELLSKMGHEPKWEVTLSLEKEERVVRQIKTRMTKENRELVRKSRVR